PIEVRTDDRAVDVLLEQLFPGVRRRPRAIAMERGVHDRDGAVVDVPRTTERLRADAHRVVRFVRRALRDRRVTEVHLRVELLVHLTADVAAEAVHQTRVRTRGPVVRGDAERVVALALERRQIEHADFIVAARGNEVAHRIRAGRQLNAGSVAIAFAERRGVRIGDRAVRTKAVLDAGPGGDRRQRALARLNEQRARRAVARERVVREVVVHVIEDAALDEAIPARGARAALLRRDDHDAVGGVGAVQRGRRRTLHDLDVLDLLGVDVAETAEVRAAVAERRRAVVGAHANAVDHVDRVIRERHRAHTAHANALARTRLPAALHHHARHAGVEHVGKIPDGRLFGELRDRDVFDRVADFDAALLAGGRRHDFLQLHDRLSHHEVERRRFVVADADRLLLLLIPDANDSNLGRAGRDAANRVLAI